MRRTVNELKVRKKNVNSKELTLKKRMFIVKS